MDQHVGNRVKERREYLEIGQPELAARIGISHQQLRKYEIGANRITAGRLFLLAVALETTIQHFYEGLQSVGRALRRGVAEEEEHFEGPDDVETTDLVMTFRSISDPSSRKAVVALAKKLAEKPETDSPKRRRKRG